MKYMVLMQGNASGMKSFGAMPPEDLRRHIQFMISLNEELAKTGELVDAQGLSGPDQAKIVRAKGPSGSVTVTDGPFPETKEFLAGYWILDCATEQRVLDLAARISGAPGKGGEPVNIAVEVRPIGQAPKV